MPSQVTTTGGTPAALWTADAKDGTALFFEAIVTARRTDGASGHRACYVRQGFAKRMGGTVTVIATSSPLTAEDDATWNCTFVAVGTEVQLQVTGIIGATIMWSLHSLKTHGDPMPTYWDAR